MKIHILFSIPIITLLTACDRVIPEVYCNKDATAKVAEWTSICIKDANPYSDEEPEDWIRQCIWSAKSLFCEKGFQWKNSNGYNITHVQPCSKAKSPHEQRTCNIPIKE